MNRLVLVLLALLLVAAGCSANGVAATVNGVAIDSSELDGVLDTDGEELSEERRRAVLTALVQWSAIEDAAIEQFSIDPTEEEIAAYAEAILSSSGATGNRAEFLSAQGVTEKGFILSANRLLVEERVLETLQADIALLTDEEAAQVIADDPGSWTVVCASDIIVSTAEEAEAVVARVESGEDFGALAVELSLAPGAASDRGDLGCGLPVDWSAPIAAAALSGEVGEVGAPFAADLGLHLLLISSRTEASIEDVQQSWLRQEAVDALQVWILDAIARSDIEVSADYGIWSTDPNPAILPSTGELVP